MNIPIYPVDLLKPEVEVHRAFLQRFEQWQRLTQLILFSVEEEMPRLPLVIKVVKYILTWQTKLLWLIAGHAHQRCETLEEEEAVKRLYWTYREPRRPLRPFYGRRGFSYENLPDPKRYAIPDGTLTCRHYNVTMEGFSDFDVWRYSELAGKWVLIDDPCKSDDDAAILDA